MMQKCLAALIGACALVFPIPVGADVNLRFIPGGYFRLVHGPIVTIVMGGPYKDPRSCMRAAIPGQTCEIGATTTDTFYRFHGTDCSPYRCQPDHFFLYETGCDREANYWNTANTEHGRPPAYVCDQVSASAYAPSH
jgi:hypothetical protein